MFRGIILIIFLAAAVSVYFILIQPLYNEVKALDAQKLSFDEALSSSRQIQATRDELLSKYNKIPKEDLDRLEKILPSRTGSMKFITQIESVVRKDGMVLKGIDVEEKREEVGGGVALGTEVSSFETAQFSVKLSGSYESFYTFLKDVEKNLRLTDIGTINFSSSETNFYEFDLRGTFYWKK